MKFKVVLGTALVGVAALAMACGSSGGSPAPAPAKPPSAAPTAPAPAAAAAVTVTTTENPYKFDPATIKVSAGKNVVKITGGKEIHTFTVADLKIDQMIQPGQSVNITIPTDKKGNFKLVCTIHEAQGQTGTITVE